MGKLEKLVAVEPPPLRAAAVIERLKICKLALVALEQEIPSLLLAVAEGYPGAKEGLQALRDQIAGTKFEIENHPKARAHAEQIDEANRVAWAATVQTLPPAQIIEGISAEACCKRCIPGISCAITGSDPLAGICAHPKLVGPLEKDHYRTNPKIQAVYAAACAKLGIGSR
jgi:hypothetical protein